MTTTTPTSALPPVEERSTHATTLGEMVMRAGERGDLVALRHPREGGDGRGHLRRAARARPRDRPRPHRDRHRAGRPGVDPRLDERRVDGMRPRLVVRGRRRGADLPHQLAGRVPARPWSLRRAPRLLRGRRAGREDRRDPRPVPRSRARRRHQRRRGGGRDFARRAATARRCNRRRRRRRARRRHRPRRSRHDRLHLWHDRAGEGLHAHARELPRGHADDPRPAAARPGRPDRLHVPPARARTLARDAGGRARRRRHDRLLGRRPQADRRRARGRQPDPFPGGAADLREAAHGDRRRRRGAAALRRRRRAALGARAGAQRSRRAARRAAPEPDRRRAVRHRRPARAREGAAGLRPATRDGARRRGADRARADRVLRRLRRAATRGLRPDRELLGGHGQPGRAHRAPARSAARCPSARCGSRPTARS